MYLMLYAPYGRTGVYMLQDYCRRLGIGTSEQEVNDLMAVLKALPKHHPLEHFCADPGTPKTRTLSPMRC